ncbi:hypothetical protein EDF38_2502 [Frigoribacterium sp. PhB160]|uniref:hypothetical protein n=1 Tax=Frigoribacterium sp. PhB160 TaxID=2485192 RepID=UPI000F4870D4|nr:hypothetical protein [Frigoribacterium sp. PhB160]ROS59646.1 hypothetical protein EDF38_2502 [Frigoribacterium sp. PhB160]
MTSATEGWESREIVELRREIESAWGAFDDIELMTWDHRVLVVRGVMGALPDAANAAARAGYGAAALSLLRDAQAFPPPWASICTKWDLVLEHAREAVECVAWPDGAPFGVLPTVAAR